MKVVLDTNVLVSGLLNPYGAPGEIVRLTSSGALEVCHDSRVLAEYREVLLRPKFGFRQPDVDALLDQIKACGHVVSPEPLPRRLRDRDDEMFLEVALSGRAKFLITGDLGDYSGHRQQHVAIVSPSQFLEGYKTNAP